MRKAPVVAATFPTEPLALDRRSPQPVGGPRRSKPQRRRLPPFPFLVALALLFPAFAHAAQPGPNVLLIIADDLGIGEPGCYGGDIPTPRIDALAAEGVKFNAAYVTAPYCAASRAALLTGRYQTRFGFEFNPVGASNADPAIGLPVAEQTLPDALQNAGYATGLIGKWHLGGTARFHPQRRGFDEFFGFLHEGHYYVPHPFDGHVTWLRRRALPGGGSGRWTSPDGRTIWSTHLNSFEPDYDADNPILRSSQPVDERENLTEALTREADGFIRRHAAQPFFLCVSYNAVHSPVQAREADLAKFEHIDDIHRRLFAAMLARLDDGIGRLTATLRETGLEENTLVFFLSDNGGPTRELTSSNHPFRGEKGQLYEGGIRIPMIARWPARLPAGVMESRMASSLDIAATIAAAAGAKMRAADGVDLIPFLTDKPDHPIHTGLYWRTGQAAAFRSGDWKVHTRQRSDAPWELFHLQQDPGEQNNVAAANPDVAARLVSGWTALDQQMVAPLWQPPGRRVQR